MSLLDRIKTDSLVARKAKDTVKASLLTTLYSEAANIGKNNGNRESTDAEVISVIKKFIKGISDTIAALNNTQHDNRYATALTELAVVEQYLPSQMSEEQLKQAIVDIVEQLNADHKAKAMGLVMKMLKERYDGQYDGQVAARIIKQILE